ncbi:hypothetical protein [Erythrobacter sp. YT30]|uniref:alginate O-acetyltransferase AlgX-related protein n=1 Tax=Erythrobacter sp. YT30 TaxID=1735012 RepID=UPI00076CDE52|nr:hypothetical protein [Erythrobacter sp. YT30]KWV91784.1 hypothetical protein AUC45_11310 [Erythrobacter sp. YT30]
MTQTLSPEAQGTDNTKRPISRALAMLLCLIPASYFILIAGYAALNFSEYGADVPRFLRYIGAPLAIAGLLIYAGRKLSPPRAANVGLISAAALFALLIIEIILNARLLFAIFNMVGMLAPEGGAEDAAVRGQSNLPPMFSSKQIQSDLDIKALDQSVLAGAPNQEVLLCANEGAPVYYTADRYGFNNPDTIYEDTIDLAIIGDSFVEGHCQFEGDTLLDRMRTLQPRSVSFGIRSGGPLLELAILGRYASHYEPDYVVMAFFEGNDWQNLERETQMEWLMPALEEDVDFGEPELTEDQKAAIDTLFQDWWSRQVSPTNVLTKSSFLRNVIALNEVWSVLGLDYPRVSKKQPIYSDILARSKELTEQWGGKFALVYIPQDVRYRGLLNKSFVYDQLRGDVLAAAEANGIEVIDLTDIFARSEDPTALYAPDAHFSPEGAQVAAEAINEWVVSQGGVKQETNADASPQSGS